MLMARNEQLFAQMCHASVRMSRAKTASLDHVVGAAAGKFENETFNTCKYRRHDDTSAWPTAKLLLNDEYRAEIGEMANALNSHRAGR